MREMRACGGASAGAGTARSRPSTRMRNDESVAKRLDVNVAGPQLHGLFEQVVDRAHDRRAAREIAQALDVVLGAAPDRRLPLRPSAPRRRACSPRIVAISSNEAISTATWPPRTISAARTAAPSLGIGDGER